MVPDRLKMSAGGERLEEVIGRTEQEELPAFQDGAFEIDGGAHFVGQRQRLATQEFLDENVPEGQISKHTMRELIGSIRVVPANEFQCPEVGEGFGEVWDMGSVWFCFLVSLSHIFRKCSLFS